MSQEVAMGPTSVWIVLSRDGRIMGVHGDEASMEEDVAARRAGGVTGHRVEQWYVQFSARGQA